MDSSQSDPESGSTITPSSVTHTPVYVFVCKTHRTQDIVNLAVARDTLLHYNIGITSQSPTTINLNGTPYFRFYWTPTIHSPSPPCDVTHAETITHPTTLITRSPTGKENSDQNSESEFNIIYLYPGRNNIDMPALKKAVRNALQNDFLVEGIKDIQIREHVPTGTYTAKIRLDRAHQMPITELGTPFSILDIQGLLVPKWTPGNQRLATERQHTLVVKNVPLYLTDNQLKAMQTELGAYFYRRHILTNDIKWKTTETVYFLLKNKTNMLPPTMDIDFHNIDPTLRIGLHPMIDDEGNIIKSCNRCGSVEHLTNTCNKIQSRSMGRQIRQKKYLNNLLGGGSAQDQKRALTKYLRDRVLKRPNPINDDPDASAYVRHLAEQMYPAPGLTTDYPKTPPPVPRSYSQAVRNDPKPIQHQQPQNDDTVISMNQQLDNLQFQLQTQIQQLAANVDKKLEDTEKATTHRINKTVEDVNCRIDQLETRIETAEHDLMTHMTDKFTEMTDNFTEMSRKMDLMLTAMHRTHTVSPTRKKPYNDSDNMDDLTLEFDHHASRTKSMNQQNKSMRSYSTVSRGRNSGDTVQQQ